MSSPDDSVLNSSALIVVGEPLQGLAERYGLPWQASATAGGLALQVGDHGLEIAGDPAIYGHPVRADFVGGAAAHRRRFGGGRGQLIAKACGFGKGIVPQVVDATAGLGRDAFVLASLGAPVLMVERVAAIHALLADALSRASSDVEIAEILTRLSLSHADSASGLPAAVASWQYAPQVVHLDPMFPHRDKSALVKKEMRLFRELAGEDGDAPRLLEAALDIATHRVVVKRPRKAPPIEGPAPQHVIGGKTSRYDLYVHRSLKGA
ncbi:class I SAM-dependent methyltransferase [Salinicola rhizosphaerae]|uniref:Ribosomal RNA small subunit methyltransferase J n=1 Tax=Salinicola rhizosphaerae TaxID=1443141 RepID=A0ABQ3E4H0_9GAMM|nr:class I SAM-dependent methyltransferase [Salinicola rhizosphaerae]GHB22908.1 ribosomal RNA small subunit methyltransferase J [Salinicola rhizosphaerae]